MRFENTSSSVKALASRCMQKSTAKLAFQKQPARHSKKEMPSCRLPAVFALGLGMRARLLVQRLQALLFALHLFSLPSGRARDPGAATRGWKSHCLGECGNGAGVPWTRSAW